MGGMLILISIFVSIIFGLILAVSWCGWYLE